MTNNNPSEWMVTHQYAGEEQFIRVFRLRDRTATDHSGNREYVDAFFQSDAEAEKAADGLNAVERAKR